MKSIVDLLEEHPLFAGLDADARELVAGCATNVHFAPDEMIFRNNDAADRFYVVRLGKAAIEINAPRGGPIVVETVGPGEILGVSWILPPYRCTFDARAVEDTSAMSFDAACLRGKCDDDPALGYELFKRFAGVVRDRLQATRLQVLDVYGSHAP